MHTSCLVLTQCFFFKRLAIQAHQSFVFAIRLLRLGHSPASYLHCFYHFNITAIACLPFCPIFVLLHVRILHHCLASLVCLPGITFLVHVVSFVFHLLPSALVEIIVSRSVTHPFSCFPPLIYFMSPSLLNFDEFKILRLLSSFAAFSIHPTLRQHRPSPRSFHFFFAVTSSCSVSPIEGLLPVRSCNYCSVHVWGNHT